MSKLLAKLKELKSKLDKLEVVEEKKPGQKTASKPLKTYIPKDTDKKLADLAMDQDKLITLNVGGKILSVSLFTITNQRFENCLQEKLLNEANIVGGVVYVDSSPKIFKHFLNLLRALQTGTHFDETDRFRIQFKHESDVEIFEIEVEKYFGKLKDEILNIVRHNLTKMPNSLGTTTHTNNANANLAFTNPRAANVNYNYDYNNNNYDGGAPVYDE